MILLSTPLFHPCEFWRSQILSNRNKYCKK